MTAVFRLCLGIALVGVAGTALAQGKPPNIHFIVDTSGSMRELPQVRNSNHQEFFTSTINGCSNPRLDAAILERDWNAAVTQPLPDPGTGAGSDLGFVNLFQDDKFYGYMTWTDSSDPLPQWTTKEQACQSQVPDWSTTNAAEYTLCLNCLGTKGYFKVKNLIYDPDNPVTRDFILWGRFLNFNPPRYVTVRAAIKKALEQVKNARVGYSSLAATNSKMRQRQSAACDVSLSDPNAFEPYRAPFIDSINGLLHFESSASARALLNAGYYFTSGDDVYRDVFGFGTSYAYPSDFRNDPLTTQNRSWCWGDQASAIVFISEGEPNIDTLSSTLTARLRTLNGGPVYCPD